MNTLVQNLLPWDFYTIDGMQEPEKYLKDTAQILDSHNAVWFLSFGTALGFYRDKGFIPKDTDIDVCVLLEDQDKIQDIVDSFHQKYKYIRSVTNDGRQMQSAFQVEGNGLILDICFFYKNDLGYYSYCDGGMWQDKFETIGTPKLFETKYGSFPMPENIEAYLKDRYGDWQTPKYGAISSSIKA